MPAPPNYPNTSSSSSSTAGRFAAFHWACSSRSASSSAFRFLNLRAQNLFSFVHSSERKKKTDSALLGSFSGFLAHRNRLSTSVTFPLFTGLLTASSNTAPIPSKHSTNSSCANSSAPFPLTPLRPSLIPSQVETTTGSARRNVARAIWAGA